MDKIPFMWYDIPQKGGDCCAHAGGIPDRIDRFSDSPCCLGSLPVYDDGCAGVADTEKAARLAALPLGGLLAASGPVYAHSQLRAGTLLHKLLRRPADVYLLGPVVLANRILEGLFRRMYGRRVSSVHVLPVPDPAPEQRTPVYSGGVFGCGSDLSPSAAPSAFRALVPLSAGGGLRPAPDGSVPFRPGSGYGNILNPASGDSTGISGPLLYAGAGDGGAGGGAGDPFGQAAGYCPESSGPAGCHCAAAALRAGPGGHPTGGAGFPSRLQEPAGGAVRAGGRGGAGPTARRSVGTGHGL